MPLRVALPLALILALGCESPPAGPLPDKAAGAAQKPTVSAPSLTHPQPKRLIAIGDVHGDIEATRRALRLGGAIDEGDKWSGGDLVVVQVGDQLDRGDDDRAILDLFDRLRDEAKAAGGQFIALNGNHETMTAPEDGRGVAPRSDRFFAGLVREAERVRAVAVMPGGVYARVLAEQPLYVIVGDSVFVHGGVLGKHLDYGLERLDGELRAWLRGERRDPPAVAVAEDGPIWARHFSAAPSKEDCVTLKGVLDRLGAKRMVMGHTPQRPKANAACDGIASRIDCGLARHYGGPTNVLEITEGGVQVLEAKE